MLVVKHFVRPLQAMGSRLADGARGEGIASQGSGSGESAARGAGMPGTAERNHDDSHLCHRLLLSRKLTERDMDLSSGIATTSL